MILNKLARLLIMASLTMLAALLAAGSATANRSLEVRGLEAGRAITVRNSGNWAFGGEFGSVVCRRLTFRGVITRSSVDKTAAGRLPEGQIGEVTEGTISECTGSFGERVSAVALAEPRTNGLRHQWLIRYAGFLGTLPNINGLKLTTLLVSFNMEGVLGGLRCQWQITGIETRLEYPARAEGNQGEFLRNRANLISELSSGSRPAEGEIRGRGLDTPATSLALL